MRGEIRAWTVKMKYRGNGLGTGLLEEAVKFAQQRPGCDGVGFAVDHANSKRFLPRYFNRVFDESEERAREALNAAIVEKGGFGRKR
ncbi:hypothetical protein BDY21DRAFT_339108 [Lineolata rhizophorae]|uniref:N-acetyltransferase domain-containing protein n=1 Tax=Lineolata rhizophorae TaxID=578093 RepID=A0A6A6P5Z9_9PEZI|nr:hypothetical protein BDY21DRAFT_339108 [Lineolata rhizophorae]